MIEPKIKDPIEVYIYGNNAKVKVSGQVFALNKQILFGGHHYGFRLIFEKGGQEFTKTFPTHNPVESVTLSLKTLRVKEFFKSNQWYFDCSGKLLNVALFNDKIKNEVDFVAQQSEGNERQELLLSNSCLGHFALRVKEQPFYGKEAVR